ncbi:Uncharacterised protein [Escherichia coli]|nr:Uncharacterised protein [Escherichia coli]
MSDHTIPEYLQPALRQYETPEKNACYRILLSEM